MTKLIWMIKQLFPLRYESTYLEEGVVMHTTWKMWMGKCYDIVTERA